MKKLIDYLFAFTYLYVKQWFLTIISNNSIQNYQNKQKDQLHKQQVIIILIMKTQPKGLDMNYLRQYNTNRIMQSGFNPIPLNVKLASNPYLKEQQKYHYLIYKLNQYNKKIANNQVKDFYESLYYQKLHTIVCDLAHIETKTDQISRLDEVFKWVKEQQHLIQQRKDQGPVRYQVNREVRFGVEPEKKQHNVSQKTTADQIPSQAVARALLPYTKNWRTSHKQLDIPLRRLNQYKRKILNIAPFIEPKEQKKPPKVTYPKVPRMQYKSQEPQEAQQPQEGQQGQPPEGSPPAMPLEGQIKQGEKKQGQQANQDQADQQQDLGGFGQQPAQPQQQEAPPEEQGEDKLAPKIKSFTRQFQDVVRETYKGAYQYYRGEQNEIQRRMQQKYLKVHNEQIKKQKEDKQAIEFLQQWAGRRAKMQKQHQKRLQNGAFISKYSISHQQPAKRQMLSNSDELKFGFTQNLKRPKMAEIQLNSTYLPKIVQEKMFEKSIRNDRLNSLKNKFGKLLNLQEHQQREASQSLCQYSSRKRGISQIMRRHSKSKQRIIQLDEVVRIKQKLARNKVGIDVRSLSMGLCVPQDQDNIPQKMFPQKILPSNPFMVETKKKKKKK